MKYNITDVTIKGFESTEGFSLMWVDKYCGFGELMFIDHGSGIHIVTENMSKEFVREVVDFFLENATYSD